jgi:hypothetical protein
VSGSNIIALVGLPGERVETRALFMPDDAPPPSSTANAFAPRVAPPPPAVTATELLGALLAVGVLTAGAAAATPLVALLLF